MSMSISNAKRQKHGALNLICMLNVEVFGWNNKNHFDNARKCQGKCHLLNKFKNNKSIMMIDYPKDEDNIQDLR